MTKSAIQEQLHPHAQAKDGGVSVSSLHNLHSSLLLCHVLPSIVRMAAEDIHFVNPFDSAEWSLPPVTIFCGRDDTKISHFA